MYTTEYLIIVNSNNTSTVKSFKSLLESDDEIKLTRSEIDFKGKKFPYQILSGIVKSGNSNPYFHIKISCTDEKEIRNYSQLLRKVRGRLLLLADDSIFTLWDDLSRYYSTEAYEKVHKVENLMRKLQSKFMLVNLGSTWTKKRLPNDLIQSKRSDNNDDNFLNNVDFIKLSDFLFSENYPSHKDNLIKKLNQAKDLSTFNVEELKSLLPQSNWSKYFGDLIDTSDNYLKNKWKELYNLRNAIAHNRTFTDSDLDKVIRLTTEVTEKLSDAIDKLDEVIVPEEEINEVVENIATERNEDIGKFITIYRNLENALKTLSIQENIINNKSPNKYTPPYQLASKLAKDSLIPKDFVESINRISQVRNVIVHGSNLNFSSSDLSDYIEDIQVKLEAISRAIAVEESDHIDRINDEKVLETYKLLKSKILSLPELELKVNRHYISFVLEKKNIADLRIQQKGIKLWINLNKLELKDDQNISKDVSAVGHLGNGDYEITITPETDLKYIISLVMQSYKKHSSSIK